MASAADYTDEQVEQIRAIFNVCDTTGDGFITKDELAGSLVKLGSAPLSDDALDSLMTQLDTDGNGKIDFDEFLHGMEAIIGSQGGAGGGDDDGGDDDGGDYGGDDDDEGVEFTEKQLQELRNIFELTDSDNSGSIDKAELGSLLRRVGHDVDDDVIDQVFGLMEVNSVGEVEFEQVVIHLGTTLLGLSEKHEEAAAEAAETGAVALTPEQEEQLIEIFNSCDVDESGELDLAELQDILQALGHHASPAELEALMAQLDEDGNGKMNLHEFLTGLGPIFVRELESQQQSAGAVKLHAEVAVQILKDMGRVDEMNSAWAEFAGDHNEVDTIDLRALMHAVGMQPTRQEIRALTKAMDPESTGYISYEHFAVEVAKKIEQSGLDRSRDANDGTEGTEGDDLGAPETLEEAMLQLSKLKDKVVALHDDVDRYKSQAEDARKAGVESNQRNTELTEQLFSLKRDLKDLRKENKQIGELQKDKRELYQEVESYQAEIQEARKREAALRKEEQELRAYKAEAVGRMSNLLNEVSRMTEESNTLREEATAATREAREIAREQKKSEAERNKDVDELRTATEALAAVQGQLASYQERYAELDERYKKLQADSEKEKIELENQLSMAGGGGKHRPNAAGSLASEMYDMGEDVVDPNKERIRDLTAELMQVESERDELREQLSAMAALQERVAAAEKALADAEAQHARDMAAAEEQFNAKRGTFDQLGEEMAAQIEGLNAEIAAAVAAKEAAEAALADEHNKLELEQAERTKALADLEAARKETADAQARMAALQEKLNDIEEARLAAQAGAANAKDTFQHEREALEKQIADLEATVAARDESLAGKDAEIEALNKRIAELEAEIERLNGELTVARSEAGSSAQALQEQLEARGKEIADLKAQMLQIAAESATNQEAANKRAADLETELAGVRDELSGANAALDKARSDLETAQAAAGEEGEAVARLSKKLEETKTALAELSDLKEQLVAKVLREKEKRHDAAEAFEARIKDAEDQLAAANATVAERDATVAEREAAIAEKDAALAEAATASAAKDTTIAERDATIEDLKARLAAAAEGNAALSDANAALDSTRADLEAANKGLAEKEAALAAAQAEVQAKVAELATAAETLAGVETSLAEKEAEVAAREATIGERDAEVVELKAEIERLKVAVTEAEAAAELQEKIVILEQKIVTVESEKEVVVVEKTDVETELASTKDQLADALSRLGELEARPEPEPQRVILSDVQDLPLEESEAALIDYVNQLLGTDIELSSYIPISKRTLSVATACQDGVVLCKLVNKVCPGTLDERVIVRDIRDEEDVLENHSLCLNSARALGANIMNMQPEDFATGRVPIVLSFMFELVKVGLLSKVSLTEHPEFIELKQSGEDMETVSRLPAEQYLVRWMNFHLEAAGSDRRVNNFSDDLADGVVYTTLFHQLAPDECDLTPLEETDPTERAKLIVEFSDRIGCKVFVNPMDIVEGNAKMNLFFLANMADKWPGITVTEQQQEEVKQIQIHDVEGTREERVYLLWIQSLGIEADVKNLLTDLSDGIALLQIFDAVKPGVVKWRRVETKKLNDFKRVENCNMACNIATEELDIILVSIDGRDIFEGNKKATYAILWQAMRYHILSIISSLSLDGKRLEEEDVCAWANDKVASVGKDTHMSSFKDKSLADGLFFIDLLFAIRSRAVNYALVTPGETEEDKELNAKYAISVARKMGALVFLLWEDIVEVKQKLLLTFVGTLMSLQQ